mgnify:CR=1 FL=1
MRRCVQEGVCPCSAVRIFSRRNPERISPFFPGGLRVAEAFGTV